MTKQLREWTAPDGERFRWNPEINAVECYAEGTGWYEVHAGIVLDHAAALNALRADPYVAPKGLREQLRDSFWQHRGVDDWADAVMALIDRERPALGEVDAEVLVAEMEKRGWKVREVGYSSHGDIYHSTEGEDPRTAYGINRVRRVLIAPERAG